MVTDPRPKITLDFATTAACTEVLWAAIDVGSVTHQIRSKHSSPSHGLPNSFLHLVDRFGRLHRGSVSGSRSVARISRSKGHTSTVSDRPEPASHPRSAGSLSTVTESPDRPPEPGPSHGSLDHLDASRLDTLSTGEPRSEVVSSVSTAVNISKVCGRLSH